MGAGGAAGRRRRPPPSSTTPWVAGMVMVGALAVLAWVSAVMRVLRGDMVEEEEDTWEGRGGLWGGTGGYEDIVDVLATRDMKSMREREQATRWGGGRAWPPPWPLSSPPSALASRVEGVGTSFSSSASCLRGFNA